MFRTLFTSFVLFSGLYAFGQTDSSIYHLFSNQHLFPNVTEVYYSTTRYGNDNIKCEGWMVEEKAGSDAVLLKVNGTTPYEMNYHKFGVWKYYYKSGRIKAIDTIFYDESGKRHGSQNFYTRKGILQTRFELTMNYVIENERQLGRSTFGLARNSSLFVNETLLRYNRKGQVIRKTVWTEGELKEDFAFVY